MNTQEYRNRYTPCVPARYKQTTEAPLVACWLINPAGTKWCLSAGKSPQSANANRGLCSSV